MQVVDPIAMPLAGPHLIEASAGTGKTYTIATLYVRLLLERGLDVDRILVVTFTEAAAAELRDRIRRRIRTALEIYDDVPGVADPDLQRLIEQRRSREDATDDRMRLELALRTFDEAAISTIHGFCHRVLHEGAFETGTGFDTELVADDSTLLREVVEDFWARRIYDADPLFVGYLAGRRVGPSSLLRLARAAASKLDAPVHPPKVTLSKRLETTDFFAQYERTRTLWLEHRPEVETLLLDHPGLHKLLRDSLPELLRGLATYFADERPGYELGWPHLSKFTPKALLSKTKKDWKSKAPAHPFFEACGALVKARAPLLEDFGARELALRHALVDEVRRELPRRKRSASVQSFDDLLQDLDRALCRRGVGRRLAESVRTRYRAALIDEFQDTDPTQYRIFRTIYGGSEAPLFLIGDPKQAIYGFRGADVFAYLEAARSIRRGKYTMDKNWRSDPDLIAALAHLFDVVRPFYLPEITFPEVAPRPDATSGLHVDGRALPAFEVKFQRRETARCTGKPPGRIAGDWVDDELPRHIAADISALLRSAPNIGTGENTRKLHAGDIAVLVRKNAQAQKVQAALRELGIPGVVYGDASVFATPQADELEHVLGAIAEPSHEGLRRAAVTTELLGVTGNELQALEEDDLSWSRWIEAFRRWNIIWTERGFIQMFRAMLADSHADRRLLALADGERRMTNLLHLAELLHTAATTNHLGPAGLLRWFQLERRSSEIPPEAVKLRLERDDRAVQLITIHRSKGLEYPVVYCPYVWAQDTLFPQDEEFLEFHDPEHGHRLSLDISLKPSFRQDRANHPNIAQARYETAAESLRLLYVALTRARHRCVVVWGGFDRAHHSALGYLLHAPAVSRTDFDPDAVADHIKGASDAQLLSWLEVRKHPTWSVSFLDTIDPQPYEAPVVQVPELRCRLLPRRVDDLFRVSSFTHMTVSVGERAAAVDLDGRDRDELTRGPDELALLEATPDERVPLEDFPRGAKVGNFFHELLEHLDFDAPDDERRLLVRTKLQAFGFDPERWLDPIDARVLDVLATPLDDRGAKLEQLSRRDRLDEFAFVFPVGDADDPRIAAVTRRSLARVFHRQPVPQNPSYADHIEQLGFSPLRGYLKGFIDLVFRHEGRWYVVDYKTNDLGPIFDDYAPDRLAMVMARDHYLLQYHLYVLAVVRFLRLRVPDFDYERDFGGVFYLFVRGMHPDRGPTRGIYFERPTAERIAALDEAMRAPPILGSSERSFAGEDA